MTTASPAEQAIELTARQIFEIADASRQRIECVEGCVWITLDHDERDIVLERGESFLADDCARALVYAFEPARLALRAADAAPPSAQIGSGRRARTTAQVAV